MYICSLTQNACTATFPSLCARVHRPRMPLGQRRQKKGFQTGPPPRGRAVHCALHAHLAHSAQKILENFFELVSPPDQAKKIFFFQGGRPLRWARRALCTARPLGPPHPKNFGKFFRVGRPTGLVIMQRVSLGPLHRRMRCLLRQTMHACLDRLHSVGLVAKL